MRMENYNFEQFREFTAMYEQARVKDEKDSKEFYRMVKYVLARTDDNGKPKDQGNLIVRDFLSKYQLDLIDIPEEFQNLEATDDFKPTRKAQTVRKRVFTRTDKDIREYDAWRCVDRSIIAPTGKEKAVCKVNFPPALLKKAFGKPEPTITGFAGTGVYEFEDTNLDLFRIHDYKQTTFYHGFNREDEFYNTVKNMKRHEKRRVKPWPSADEFWELEEPREFRLLAGSQADWRKFKRWLNNHLRKIEGSEFDYDTECLAKHEANLDICLGDYDKEDEINTSMAVYNWNNTMYMTDKEVESMPKDKKTVQPVPPTMFDLNKAERVIIDKDNLKVQEIQAEQERLSGFI